MMIKRWICSTYVVALLFVRFDSMASKMDNEEPCPDGSCGANYTLPDIESNGNIQFTFGLAQKVGVSPSEKMMDLMRNINSYMTEQDQEKCRLNYDQCILWASTGECELNPNFMKKECAPACFTCYIATMPFEQRCPMPLESDLRIQNAWENGDLNRMFERIVQDEQIKEEYGLSVVLRPGMPNSIQKDRGSPWIITLDTFLSEGECKDLIQHGYRMGYAESTVLSAPDKSDISKGSRTSSNTWCRDHCFEAATPILKRIERLTGIPMVNYEHLQLLKYQVGQFYKTHSDFIPHHLERVQGPRLLTVFLYLNDVPEGL